MVKIYVGDVFESNADIICHQVNCLGIMGGGIALEIRKRYPNVYDDYHTYCTSHENAKDLLGKVQFCGTTDSDGRRFEIANMFSQLDIGTGCKTRYDELEKALITVRDRALKENKTVAIPYGIGCGLAGGKWAVVYATILKVFNCTDVKVTIYKLPQEKVSAVFYD